MQSIESTTLFQLIDQSFPVVDVRSEGEFAHGHLPNAINLPLFNNEERAIIGKKYKQSGKEEAISLGLEIIGPKLSKFNDFVRKEISAEAVIMYCWRGGMRSASMAWLFELLGKKVYLLKGGYKSYRNFVIEQLNTLQLKISILGGRTGSGKTEILKELKKLNQQIVDLEDLADHKGSAFGWIGRTNEVKTEQFENNIYTAIRKLDRNQNIWIENESRGVGIAQIPENLFSQMKKAKVYNLEIDLASRLNNLVNTYEKDNTEELIISFEKIRKRLGHERTDKAIEFLRLNNFKDAAEIALSYYDKSYDYGITNREKESIFNLQFSQASHSEIAQQLLKYITIERNKINTV